MATTRTLIADFLGTVPFLAELGERDIGRFAERAVVLEPARGTVIFRQGDPCAALHVVAHGQVKLLFQNGVGDEKVVELIGAGQIFGEAALFLGECHLVTAEAVSYSRVVLLPKEVLLEEIRHNPDFSWRVIDELSRRLYERTRDLESCVLRSGTERVIGYLLNQLPADTINGEGLVTFPAKKGIIASKLNLTHEHFSRILRDLATDGLIGVEGRNVRLPDLNKLHARLNGAG